LHVTEQLDIYVRVSEVGDRAGESFGSPAEQEAAARAWAERAGVTIGEVVSELDVSGATPVDERELGRLIRKCEAGESGGIIVRYADRFARDIIEGARALQRIHEAGARLVATASSFDSGNLTADTRMLFNIQMSIAQAQRERSREFRLQAAQRAAANGMYLAGRPPLGYSRDEKGRIHPHPEAKALIREAFRRRAKGVTMRALRDYLRAAGAEIETRDLRARKQERQILRPFAHLTEQGVRHLLKNRAYLGEATVPNGDKGKPTVIPNAHPALITPETWERAQTAGGSYHPKNGRHASRARLAGLVYCERGHRLKVGGGRGGRTHYVCTTEDCDARVGIGAEQLDAYVGYLIQAAVLHREPHVIAVLQGDDRYQRALDAVEAARLELETYRATIKVSDVGAEAWKRDVATRQATLDLARGELRSLPAPPRDPYAVPTIAGESFAEWLPRHERELNAQFVDRVLVRPVGHGRRAPVAERVAVYFLGAEAPWREPEGDPETMALLATAADAETIRADLEERAAKGDQSAKDYLAAKAAAAT
jgi:DNA invertase Pin-like site-specific DNA recombinase